MSRTSRRPGRPTVAHHVFVAADGVPADPWSGLVPCRECHKLGREGDAQHPTDTATAGRPDNSRVVAARELEARILGERD